MNPEDPLAEQILGIQLIPSLPKLGRGYFFGFFWIRQSCHKLRVDGVIIRFGSKTANGN